MEWECSDVEMGGKVKDGKRTRGGEMAQRLKTLTDLVDDLRSVLMAPCTHEHSRVHTHTHTTKRCTLHLTTQKPLVTAGRGASLG